MKTHPSLFNKSKIKYVNWEFILATALAAAYLISRWSDFSRGLWDGLNGF